MKESFLWGGGLQIHKHWEHLQGFSQKKKVKIAVFLHLIRTPEVGTYGLHPRLSQKILRKGQRDL